MWKPVGQRLLQGDPLITKDRLPLAQLILPPLFSVNKALFRPALHCAVFLGKSNSKRQLAEVLELLLLVIGPRRHLLNSTYDRAEIEKPELLTTLWSGRTSLDLLSHEKIVSNVCKTLFKIF